MSLDGIDANGIGDEDEDDNDEAEEEGEDESERCCFRNNSLDREDSYH